MILLKLRFSSNTDWYCHMCFHSLRKQGMPSFSTLLRKSEEVFRYVYLFGPSIALWFRSLHMSSQLRHCQKFEHYLCIRRVWIHKTCRDDTWVTLGIQNMLHSMTTKRESDLTYESAKWSPEDPPKSLSWNSAYMSRERLIGSEYI